MNYSQQAIDRAALLRANFPKCPMDEAWYYYDKSEPLSDEKYLYRAVICILCEAEKEIQ